MVDVSYTHQSPYVYSNTGRAFPGLMIRLKTAEGAAEGFDVQAHLDTGAERSLFDGEIAMALGMNLLAGAEARFAFTSGAGVEAREHDVVLVHDLLGEFFIKIAFSTTPISRNILGRDFLSAIQIGFRERFLEIYVTTAP